MARVGYARVSTEEQNADMQITALTANGCDVIFADKASGASKCRPELAKCLASLTDGDVLVVWKIDRLARSTLHLCEIIEDLKSRGVSFCATSQAIDTSNAGGMLTFQILGAIAEFERELIRERTRAGMAAAKGRGTRIGRPRLDVPADKLSRRTQYRRKQEIF